jgi:hypothetical protein
LDEQAIADLADHLSNIVGRKMADTLRLADDNSQRMFISTQVAALAFGMAARFMQISAAEKGLSFEWDESLYAIVSHVSKLAIDNPPDPPEPLARHIARTFKP